MGAPCGKGPEYGGGVGGERGAGPIAAGRFDANIPLVNVFALAGGALDHIIDVIGRAAIEAVLDISAADVGVYLADRAVRVEKPRCAAPGEGELAIPAYEALRRPSGRGERMREPLLAGLSTRSYGKAIGEMAETAGVSKSW